MKFNVAIAKAELVGGSTPGQWVTKRLDVFGGPGGPLERAVFLDSFLPSLMPRTSVHQGLAAGVNVVTARAITTALESVRRFAIGSTGGGTSLGIRAVEAAIGHGLANLPEVEDETLWRSGARSTGEVLRAAAIGGAIYETVGLVRARTPRGALRPLVLGAAATSGLLVWASRRLMVRKSEIQRWPVVQDADTLNAFGVGAAVTAAGTGLGMAFRVTGRGLRSYFGPGVGKQLLGSAANAALWMAGASAAYNGAIAYIGRSNEKMERPFSTPPSSPLASGSAQSLSPFSELGQQGRRFVSEAVTVERIEEVMGEPAVAAPIRTFVGFNSAPLYTTGRAELALAELERTDAFDRSYLLLVSPTGTGWVDQTVVAAAEFLARGDIATCSIQYGRFPSFLCVQKVGLGRAQFRLLLWGVRQRLAERPPEQRPKVLVFGESLGAWTASDVMMSQGIKGFDHYGIDRALWMGLPALAKWSRNGMAAGSSELVPEGTVGVFDRHEQLAALDEEAQDRLRAVILSHDNDPIAAVRPELMIQRPDWLRGERGRNVSTLMDWIPFVTFWQVAIDAANAMVTVPGEFRSFGHDYRADTARFTRDAYHLPATDEAQTQRIEEALRQRDLDRKALLSADPPENVEPILPSARLSQEEFHAGVPMMIEKASGPRWFRKRQEPALGAATDVPDDVSGEPE